MDTQADSNRGVYAATEAPLEEYLYLGDRLVGLARNGVLCPVLTGLNGGGQAGQVLDPATGTALWTWEGREPFGNSKPTEVNDFTFDGRFHGQWYDDMTGLSFNGHRDYDSKTAAMHWMWSEMIILIAIIAAFCCVLLLALKALHVKAAYAVSALVFIALMAIAITIVVAVGDRPPASPALGPSSFGVMQSFSPHGQVFV